MQAQGLGGMGGGSVRLPGKSKLTFDHILSRLQGELQKGAELHDIHDTFGRSLVGFYVILIICLVNGWANDDLDLAIQPPSRPTTTSKPRSTRTSPSLTNTRPTTLIDNFSISHHHHPYLSPQSDTSKPNCKTPNPCSQRTLRRSTC